jgi:hypothetical protein
MRSPSGVSFMSAKAPTAENDRIVRLALPLLPTNAAIAFAKQLTACSFAIAVAIFSKFKSQNKQKSR